MMTKFDRWFFNLKWPFPFIVVVAFMVCFAVVTYKKKYLTKSGAFAAFVTGVVVLWCVHIQGFILLLFFFASSNFWGKYRLSKQKKNDIDIGEKKGSTRDYMQVLANGLMAVVAAISYYNTEYAGALVMFGSSIAEATSDTWAGEIGRLSSKPPVSIRTFRIVPKGISGGVTPLGFLGAFFGSFTVALLYLLFFRTGYRFISFTIVTLTGFAGCLVDSFLGATFQAIYIDEKNALTEKDVSPDGKKRKLVRGIAWLDNDMVNLASNVFSAFFAIALSKLLFV